MALDRALTKPERLTEILNLRLSPSEYDAVCREAFARGWTLTEYLRKKLGLTCKTLDEDFSAPN